VHRFAPLLASALTLTAGFCTITALRMSMLLLAIVLFLWIAADFARSLLERETSFASEQGPPKEIPVTPGQIGLTAMLGGMYACMIVAGLHLIFFSYRLLFMFIVMLPVFFVFACLAAWRNVRLWYRQGADYEQALKEEAAERQTIHIPPAH
jgi:hypothetical protein